MQAYIMYPYSEIFKNELSFSYNSQMYLRKLKYDNLVKKSEKFFKEWKSMKKLQALIQLDQPMAKVFKILLAD